MDLSEKNVQAWRMRSASLNVGQRFDEFAWGSPAIDRARCRSPGFSLPLEIINIDHRSSARRQTLNEVSDDKA